LPFALSLSFLVSRWCSYSQLLYSLSAQGEGTPQPHPLAKGRNAMLPCSFSPEQHAQHMEVSWFWEQLSPFYGEQITHLKIFHVQLSDRGNYTCFL
uniref:Ig-like domain-containing protein n=1 Tax=Zonotrichia albicollis TaxID=44394 RepID=A0A8D2M2K1_ZONAL